MKRAQALIHIVYLNTQFNGLKLNTCVFSMRPLLNAVLKEKEITNFTYFRIDEKIKYSCCANVKSKQLNMSLKKAF